MGMLDDILNSIQNAGAGNPGSGSMPAPSGGAPLPGGGSMPSAQQGQQGMSTMAKVLLALLAMYAVKNVKRAPSAQPSGQQPAPTGGTPGGGLGDILKGPLGGIFGGGNAPANSGAGGGSPGGGLGDLLKGPLGGLLAGAGAGGLLNGGLDNLLKQFQQSGHGALADSWVGRGANQPIDEGDLAKALGSDTLDALANQSGMPRDEILSGLSQHLPRFVDQLTPDGRLPSGQEAERML